MTEAVVWLLVGKRESGGVWGGFAAATVNDWLTVLSAHQSPQERDSAEGSARRTLALAVL